MVEDTPDDLVFELHNAALWGQHPYGYSILGTRDTVSQLGTAELRALHERAYHPEHIIVAAAGNVDHDALLEVLARTGWADRPRGGHAATHGGPGARDRRRRSSHVDREGAQTHMVFGSRAVRHGDPRRHALVLVSTLMGGGMSSRLFQRVREELGLAYAVYTFQITPRAHGDARGVRGDGAGDRRPGARRHPRPNCARLADDGLPASELAMGKDQLKGRLVLSLESPASRMYRAASVALYDEPYRSLDELLALVDAVDEASVSEVARTFFDPAAQTILSLGPGSAS